MLFLGFPNYAVNCFEVVTHLWLQLHSPLWLDTGTAQLFAITNNIVKTILCT